MTFSSVNSRERLPARLSLQRRKTGHYSKYSKMTVARQTQYSFQLTALQMNILYRAEPR
jgi:hypothetical protein